MPLLIAIRHAKSSWKHPETSDHERPLNKRGKRAAPMIGAELQRLGMAPERLLSSPARRALDTARLVGEALGQGTEDILLDDRLYLEGVSGIEAAVAAALMREPDLERLAFFSHEPAISSFCAAYGGIPAGTHYPTGAACGMRFEQEDWAAFAGGKDQQPRGKAVFFLLPRNLED